MLNGNNPVILKTNIPYLKLYNSGKVRDIYELDDSLLIIATDRISAFDYVIPNLNGVNMMINYLFIDEIFTPDSSRFWLMLIQKMFILI
jgi:phosphoribosylaminoimidazole-succinocarboxamide synthase